MTRASLPLKTAGTSTSCIETDLGFERHQITILHLKLENEMTLFARIILAAIAFILILAPDIAGSANIDIHLNTALINFLFFVGALILVNVVFYDVMVLLIDADERKYQDDRKL